MLNSFLSCLTPLSPTSDQDRISPYSINTISSRQLTRILKKYQLGDCWLIQLQILQTSITWIVWQTVRRITSEILGVKRLNKLFSPPAAMQFLELEQLHTYPSPNPTLTLTCYQLTVVVVGEGWVGSCSDNNIDPMKSVWYHDYIP